ncbi:MAG: hypothetical protein M1821_001458 [Bathelium mastoideum]|nr:MAG: hypothetical protein M1821_001458 [Bathelium mastoideum]
MYHFNSAGGGDSYRPSDHDRGHDFYAPPPRGPPQRGRGRGRSLRHSRNNNDPRQGNHDNGPRQSLSDNGPRQGNHDNGPRQGNHDFTFRSERQAPDFANLNDASASRSHGAHPNGFRTNDPTRSYHSSDSGRRPKPGPSSFRNKQRQQGSGQRGGFRFGRTYDRPLLKARRDATPERLAGMSKGASRFRAVEDLSGTDTSVVSASDEDEQTDHGPSSKRRARGDDKPTELGMDVAPKWSNPDPYTVLPPPDESKGKKKDVVKMIRKAKITQEKNEDAPPSMAEDFISFDFGEDKSEANSTSDGDIIEVSRDVALKGKSHVASRVPTGRPFAPVPVGSVPAPPSAASLSGYSLDENLQYRRTSAQPSKKRKRDGSVDGSVLPHWMAIDARSAKPWCTIDRSDEQDTAQWLHLEVRDFYEYAMPRDFEAEMRRDLVNRVSTVMRQKFAAQVECFGSFAAGLYLPTADMDLVALSDQFVSGYPPRLGHGKSNNIYLIAERIDNAGIMQYKSKEVVAKAKVPLVKFIDSETGLRVDVSFENPTGVHALSTFDSWKRDYPAMPFLVYVIKQFLSMRGLNELYMGGMSSFTIVCLVVSFLHHHPIVQNGSMPQLDHLGNLLLSFFDFYGNHFDVRTQEVQLNPPGLLPKRKDASGNIDRICVIDPNNFSNNISRGTRHTAVILRAFSEAYRTLMRRMDEVEKQSPSQRKGRSILGSIIGGDYSSYENQRTRLRNLARHKSKQDGKRKK